MVGNQHTNTPPCIAVIQKWNLSYHGINISEGPYVNYMETKYLLSWDTHYYDSDTDTDDEGNRYTVEEKIDDALAFADPDTIIQGDRNAWRRHIVCIIRKQYIYRERTFCVRSYGIEKFQRKWRDYYNKKLAFARNIKNLRYRQLYGKYPKNKLNL